MHVVTERSHFSVQDNRGSSWTRVSMITMAGKKTWPITHWLLQLPPGSDRLHFHSVHWRKQETQPRLQRAREVQPAVCPEEESQNDLPTSMKITLWLLQERDGVAFRRMLMGNWGKRKGYLRLEPFEHLSSQSWPLALTSRYECLVASRACFCHSQAPV